MAPMEEVELRQAKASLPAAVEAAERGQSTTITNHGRPVAVIMSHTEWTKLKSTVRSFANLLLAIPPLDPEVLPKRRPARIVRRRGIGPG
jgi:antitoxin Phd